MCNLRFILLLIIYILTSSSNNSTSNRRKFRSLVEKWNWGNDDDYFPNGTDVRNRIAICLTGQLRSANLTWNSGHLLQNGNWKMFGEADPPTTASTIIEWLFRPLAKKHGLDVFMYLTAHPDHKNDTWDGKPESYQPSVNDIQGCEIFSKNPVFNNTGNKFFCLVEPEVQLMTPFLRKYHIWDHYYTANGAPMHLREQVLQQLYALYRANLAAKQYALQSGVHYKYKIRLRPDTAFVKPFPPLDSIDFSKRTGNLIGTIYYASRTIYSNGNEDWFNIGLAEHMDHLLDRYEDLISKPLLFASRKAWYTLEDILVGTLGQRYNISLGWHPDIWMVVIRVAHHSMNTWLPPENTVEWRDISVS
jgi:hypothetical protein